MGGQAAEPQGAQGAHMGKTCDSGDVWEELDRLLNDLGDTSRSSSRRSSVEGHGSHAASPAWDSSMQPWGSNCDRQQQPWGSIRDSSSSDEMCEATFISFEGGDAQVAASESFDSSTSVSASVTSTSASGEGMVLLSPGPSPKSIFAGPRKKSKNFIIVDLFDLHCEEEETVSLPWLRQSPIVAPGPQQAASAGVKPRRFRTFTVEDYLGPTQDTEGQIRESAWGEEFAVHNVRQGACGAIHTVELKPRAAGEEDPSLLLTHSCSGRLPEIPEECFFQIAQVSNGSDDEQCHESNDNFPCCDRLLSSSFVEPWPRVRSVSANK